FLEFARDSVLVAHNAAFDATVLGMEFGRHRLPDTDLPLLDSLKLARRLYPGGSYSLDSLSEMVGLPVQDVTRHRAMGDADLVRHLVRRMVETVGGDDKPIDVLLHHQKAERL